MPPQTKQSLRSEVLWKRKSLDEATAEANSLIVRVMLDASELLSGVSVVLCYVSAKDNEVATHQIIRELLTQGKTIFVPLCDRKSSIMQWSRLTALEELERTHFGLLEPSAQYVRIEAVPDGAVCLVPGVAFTRDGWRIGYGGGYFDRFLNGFSGISVGLAHGVQLIDTISTQPHDCPVDYLVTESGVIDCRELRSLGFKNG